MKRIVCIILSCLILTAALSVFSNGATELPEVCFHSVSVWVETAAPTCSTEGEANQICKYCGKVFKTDSVPVEPDAHIIGEPSVTKNATFSAVGEMKYSCTLCSYYYTEVIPVIDGVKGDISGDGKVNATDALYLSLHLANKKYIADDRLVYADVNEDEKVNAFDALRLKLFLAKKISQL